MSSCVITVTDIGAKVCLKCVSQILPRPALSGFRYRDTFNVQFRKTRSFTLLRRSEWAKLASGRDAGIAAVRLFMLRRALHELTPWRRAGFETAIPDALPTAQA